MLQSSRQTLPHTRPAPVAPNASGGAGSRVPEARGSDDIFWSLAPSLASLQQEWRVFERSAVCTPFQHFDWIAAIAQAEAERGREPVFAVGRRGDEIAAILPLVLERTRLGSRLGWLGEHHSDYPMPLVAPDLFVGLGTGGVEALLDDVRMLCGFPDAVILRRQPEQIDGTRNPFAAWHASREPISAYARRLGGDWDRLYETIYSASMRKRHRQRQRGLEQAGDCRCGEITDRAEMTRVLGLLLDWKAAQIAGKGGRNRMARREDRDHLFAYLHAPKSGARLFALTVDGRPVAAAFGLDAPDRIVIYQMGYEAGPLEKHSPGAMLVKELLRLAVAEGKSLLDLAVGDETYKQELCDRRLDLFASMRAYSLRGRILVAKERAALAAKAWLKAHPRLLAGLFAVRARLISGG